MFEIFFGRFPHTTYLFPTFFLRKIDLRQPQVGQDATCNGGVVAGRVLADLRLMKDEKTGKLTSLTDLVVTVWRAAARGQKAPLPPRAPAPLPPRAQVTVAF